MLSDAKSEGGKLLLGVALVVLIDQLCGLSSMLERWDGGSPSGLMALGTVWGDHLASLAILAVVAVAGLALTGRRFGPTGIGILAFGVLSLLTVVPMLEGYARILESTPILDLGRFQLGLGRQIASNVVFGAFLIVLWVGGRRALAGSRQ